MKLWKIEKVERIPEIIYESVGNYRIKLAIQASFWVAAIATGIAAVLFTDLITVVQGWYIQFYTLHPYWMFLLTPLAFLVAVGLPVYIAPHAKGSGIPQVVAAVAVAGEPGRKLEKRELITLKTAAVKVFSTSFGMLGGASIGGEGPTVQIAASIFSFIGIKIRKIIPQIDLQSYLIAAAGAGIAAAFNTPLGGVAFALEEFAEEGFGSLRYAVMVGVIVAGITAQAFLGNYLYFGHPELVHSLFDLTLDAIVIGVVGGICGGLFSYLVCFPVFGFRRIRRWWVQALICGIGVAWIDFWFSGKSGGSGYEITRTFLETGEAANIPLLFPIGKLLATALSTISGMGGGIFSPSISVGAWLGVSIGKIVHFSNLKSCALLGMVAYFTGAFQSPLTAVIIVMEMTDEHAIILPMMIAAVLAYGIGKVIMPTPIYHILAKAYRKEY